MERASSAIRYVGRLLGLAVGIGTLAGLELWRSFSQASSTAERTVTGLVALLAEQTERTVQAIDLTLIGMRDALQVAPSLPANDPSYRATMSHRLKRLPAVRGLFVIGSDGFITHDTDYPTTPHVNLADRPYFRAHLDDPGLALHIGEPLLSRSVDKWFVSFSRRIADSDGAFAGVAVAAIDPRYFKHFYEAVSVGDNDLIALILRNGTLLARTPDHDEYFGRSYPESPLLKQAVARGSGIAWSSSPIDGLKRLVGYRTVADGSIIIMAGLSEGSVYDSWVEHAAIVSGGAVLVWMLAGGLTLLSLEYRRREQQERVRLAQVQRLELMGRIAGGIAHDLGNTIKIARTTFSLLKPALTSQHDALTLMDDADKSLRSAFEIIDRLLAFARRQELTPRTTDLEELLVGFAPILRQAAGPRIELVVVIVKRSACMVDPIHLESALLNLVLNSKDAMPDGGHIDIELRQALAPSSSKGGRARRSATGPWAEIVVSDNGAGMPRDVQERAFEPFFTTRSGGNGLGLSQVLGFVQQSAGEIWIESRQGDGTKVHLLFPAVPDATEAAVAPTFPRPIARETGG